MVRRDGSGPAGQQRIVTLLDPDKHSEALCGKVRRAESCILQRVPRFLQ